MDINGQHFLLLPIEIKVRELHAKLLLSCFAAEAGFSIILGQQNEIIDYLKYLPRGIYIDKSIAKVNIKNFQKNKKIGNRIVAWCEEGLTFRDMQSYLKERINIEAYNLLDLFFAWGNHQAITIKNKITNNNDKIICTGNPRLDLLRDPYRNIFFPEAERIGAKYGSFILINTNFSRYNHFFGRDYLIRILEEKGLIQNEQDKAFMAKWAEYLGTIYKYFLEMIRQLSESFPNQTIVVRPHPSENINQWKKETQMLQNVEIIHEGNVISWILASVMVIHNSCTTGVEAYILEKPVISYCPVTSDIFDSELPNGISRRVFTENDLIRLVRAIIKEKDDGITKLQNDTKAEELIDKYITAKCGAFACEKIIAELTSLSKSEYQITDNTGFRTERIGKKIRSCAISTKRIFRRIIKGGGPGYAYLQHKFPGLSLKEVQNICKSFQQVEHRFDNIKIKEVSGTKSCFWIHQAKA